MKLPIILSLGFVLATATMAFASPAPALLQMRLVEDKASADSEPMSYITQSHSGAYTNVLNVRKTVLLDQTALKSAKLRNDNMGRPEIQMTFTKSGADRFAEITRENTKKRLAIIINGTICEAPIIQDPIFDGTAEISGMFTKQEAQAVVQQLNAAVAGQ